jgi:hypothetical protein
MGMKRKMMAIRLGCGTQAKDIQGVHLREALVTKLRKQLVYTLIPKSSKR